MSNPSRRKHVRRPAFKVGDRVRFSFGTRDLRGTIIEDRGPLAAGGRRIFVVRAAIDSTTKFEIELPDDELRAA